MTSILIGLLSLISVIFTVGSVSAFFLWLMSQSQEVFLFHPAMVWALPAIGLVTGWVYLKWGRTSPSTAKILQHAHTPSSFIPFVTALFIFFFTLLSQLFGASTGRESTAVQFGAGLSESIRNLTVRWSKKSTLTRETFIRCGLAAGFGAVFGVPWAGAVFALEATPLRKWPWRQIPLVLISSFGAHSVAMALGASHKIYPSFPVLTWGWLLTAQWLALGLVFGTAGNIFLVSLHSIEKAFARLRWPWLRPAVGGLLIAVLSAWVFRNTRYNGLGIPLIKSSFAGQAHTLDFLWKGLFTVLSTGSGLKGGEVTPLMALGASLGGVVASYLSLPVIYAASLGLVTVFAAAAHIPWTGAILAWEFFGFEAFLPAFVICWIAHKLVGRRGLFALLTE